VEAPIEEGMVVVRGFQPDETWRQIVGEYLESIECLGRACMISASGAAALTREPRSSQVLLPGTRSYLTPGKIIMAAALLTGVLAVWPAARGVNETHVAHETRLLQKVQEQLRNASMTH
jgi:hypothetical protein